MENTLCNFLTFKKSHAEELSRFLVEHQQNVISSLGGLTNIVELCLSNPQAKQHIDIECKPFEAFNQQLTNKINSISTDIVQETNTIDTNEIKIDKDEKNYTNTNISDTLKSQSNNTLSMTQSRGTLQIIHTAKDFDKSKIIMQCNPKNNFLFKCIHNNNQGSNVYKAILNPINLFIVSIFYFLSIIIEYLGIDLTILYIFRIIGYTLALIYYVGIGLTANLMMIDLILKTFDFWFKVYNILTLIIAIWVRAVHTDPTTVSMATSLRVLNFVCGITFNVSTIMVILLLFVLDALPLSIKIKRIFIAAFVVLVSIFLTVIYFNYQDFQWNPFGNKFQYTQISFKSLMLSSWFNLMIFVGKPVFTDVARFLRKSKLVNVINVCNCHRETDTKTVNNHDRSLSAAVNENTYRCGTIYKRPWVKWNKINGSQIDDENVSSMDIEMESISTVLKDN